MKKIMQSLLVLLLALSLTACSNNTEVEPTPTPTTTSESEQVDTNFYVPIGTKELNLDELVLPLDDYTYDSIEINKDKSNYDLNTKGEYELVLDLKDENGEVIKEVNITLIVNEKDNNSDEELVTKPSDDGKATTTQNPEKTESNKTQSNNTSSNNTSSSNTNSSDTNGSSSDWNGGLNTDPTVYGLDPNNEYVKEAMKLVGETGRCDIVVGDLWVAVGSPLQPYTYESNRWEDLSGCIDIGDVIVYTALNGDTSVNHQATYLGNGLALQGNWTGGVARIANAYQPANYYVLQSAYDKDDCMACTNCSVGGSNPEREEEYKAEKEEVANTITEEYCRVTLVYDLSTAEFAVCEELYGSDVFNWG